MDCLYKMEATNLIGLRTLYINLAITVVLWLLYFVLLYQTMHSAVSFVRISQTQIYCYCSVSLSMDGYLGFTITISLH